MDSRRLSIILIDGTYEYNTNQVNSMISGKYISTIRVGDTYHPPVNTNRIIVNLFTGSKYWSATCVLNAYIFSEGENYIRFGSAEFSCNIHILANGDMSISVPELNDGTKFSNAYAKIYLG